MSGIKCTAQQGKKSCGKLLNHLLDKKKGEGPGI
jgi:hypothetical protein